MGVNCLTNSHNDQLPDVLVAQLVEHCTCKCRIVGWNPVKPANGNTC